MSVEVYVFLNASDLPSSAAWQAAIRTAEFPIDLDSTFNPKQHSGFVPCKFSGSATGFEYLLSSQEDVVSAYPDLQRLVRPYDSAVSFSWGGDLNECGAAILTAAVLTKLCSGVMYDPQDDLRLTGIEPISYARQLLGQIVKSGH